MNPAVFFVLNHLWQSTLVAGAAWLACGAMLKANSPAARFAVWLAASVKFLIPFAVLVDAGQRFYLRPLIAPSWSERVFNFVATGNSALAMAPFRAAPASQAPLLSVRPLLVGLMVVWALGAAVVLSQWLAAWWRMRRTAGEAIPHGSFQGVPVFESPTLRDERIEPGVFGFWRQRILMPEGIEAALTPSEFHAVLLHEWNHARRLDNFAAGLQMLAEAIFWFYPVVWTLGRRLSEERELACDQAVLEHGGSEHAEAYAEGILKVCKLYRGSRLACVAGITGTI